MIISTDTEKALTISHTLHNKNVRKPGPGNFLNMVKNIHEKSTAKIRFSGETLKPSLQRLGMRQQCPLSPLLFNTVLQFYPK